MFTVSITHSFSLWSFARRHLSVSALVLLICFGYTLTPPTTHAADNTAFCATVTDVTADECLALMSIYDSTGGPNWTTKIGWGVSPTVHLWSGINSSESCTGEERVCTQVPVYENICTPVYENICNQVCDENGENCYDDCQDVYQYDDCQDVYQYDVEECTGDGITCTYSITGLILVNNNLIGDFDIAPALESIDSIDLSNNQLTSFTNSMEWWYVLLLNLQNNLISSLNNMENVYGLQQGNMANNCLSRSSVDTPTLNWLNQYIGGWKVRNSACPEVPFCETVTDVSVDECEALMSIYNNTDGDNWTNHNGWGMSTSVCTWNGVSCYGDYVVELSLNSRHMVGAFAITEGSFTGIQSINISDNQLTSFDGTGLESLQALLINNNLITAFDSSNMPALGVLNIENNLLRTIAMNTNIQNPTLLTTNNCFTRSSMNDILWGWIFFPGSTWERNSACSEVSFCETVTDVSVAECEALMSIYNNTDGDNWTNHNGWGTSTSVCTWNGVTCSNDDHVVFLTLNYNNIVGPFTIAQGNLNFLEYLGLNGNLLTSFDGTGMGALQTLGLEGNLLTSFDGTDLGSLQELQLGGGNRLTSFDGTGMGALQTLSLEGNLLASFDGTGMSALQYLSLVNNGLTSFDGTEMIGLKYLYLGSNLLDSLTNISHLFQTNHVLSVSNNCLVRSSMDSETFAGVSQKDSDWNVRNFSCPEVSFCERVADVPVAECEALMSIYNNTDGDNWTNHDSWGSSENVCTWQGVTCSNDNHVINLDLNDNNLTGSFDITEGNLNSLNFLDVSENELLSFNGADLRALTDLNIENNLIISLPDINTLPELSSLHATNNCLSGSSLGNSLSSWLNQHALDNWETQNVSCPSSFCTTVTDINPLECTALLEIYTNTGGSNWKNKSGWGSDTTVCNWFGITCNNNHVTSLNLDSNNLTGSILFSRGKLNFLSQLDLNRNHITSFSGAGLSRLETLDLNRNHITSFSGAGLSRLETLDLNRNHITSFSGAGLDTITRLELGSNQLTSFSGAGFGTVRYLNLENNQLTSFSGAGLSELGDLNLQDNQIISFSGAGLNSIRVLFLTNNQLTSFSGAGLDTITKLDLGLNQLTSFSGAGLNLLNALILEQNQISTLEEVTNIENIVQLNTGNNCLVRAGLAGDIITWLDQYSWGDWTVQSNDCNATLVLPRVSNITDTAGTITWETDIVASSQVKIRLPGNNSWYRYGVFNLTPEINVSPGVTDHSVTLSNLNPCTSYTYNIISRNTSTHNIIADSLNQTFTTTGCIASSPILDTSSEQITKADGGSLVLKDENLNGLELTVPSAFALSDANFQSKQLDKATVLGSIGTPTDRTLVKDLLYELKAATGVSTPISTFDNPLTMSMTYGTGDIAGIDELSLRIHSWGGETWSMLPNCVVNSGTRTVTCTTTHFSVFGLFGEEHVAPTITTPTSSAITTTGATLGATVTSLGIPPDSISARGICWGTTAAPLTHCTPEGGTTLGAFTQTVAGLTPNTTYYFRGYAINTTGTAYSEDGTFTTLNDTVIPPSGGGGGTSITLQSAPKETPAVSHTSLDSFLQKKLTEKSTKLATRLETVMFALKTGGISMEKEYTCLNLFTDTAGKSVPFYTCQVAEKAQATKIISETNTEFNPLKPVSRIEAYAIMMKSICVMPETTNTNWQKEVIKKAMELGFTVRTFDTFEPERLMTKQEMYTMVQRFREYKKVHGTCSSIK